jgi:hypothetical protein
MENGEDMVAFARVEGGLSMRWICSGLPKAPMEEG